MKVSGRISGWTGEVCDPAERVVTVSGFYVLGASGREGNRRKGV